MGTLAGDEIESGGLTGALSTLLVPLAESGVQVSISVGELDCEGRVRSLIHRVAQELVRNVAKHAGAHQVELTLNQERGEIRLCLMDDGQGFDTAAVHERQHRGHMGLLLVEQRVQDAGGVLEVSSAPGRGTRVVMRLPRRASGRSLGARLPRPGGERRREPGHPPPRSPRWTGGALSRPAWAQ